MKQTLLKRFDADPALKLLFAKVLDRFFLCLSQENFTFTDFYDPAKTASFFDALPLSSVSIRVFGGAPDCERRMLGFAPLSETLTDPDFPIDRLILTFDTRFNKPPRHQDILGAVLGLGIDRSRIGDIRLLDGHAEMFVHNEISGYILTQLESAGKAPLKVTKAALEAESALVFTAEKTFTVPSLRLDAVIASAFQLSRNQSSGYIAGEKVLVNWSPVKEPARNVKEGDMITLRGHGRVKLLAVEGKTKKDRIRLRLQVF